MVPIMPAHRPLVKVIKPIHKQIQVWPEGSSEALQDCFDTTDWNMFKQAATYNNTTDLQSPIHTARWSRKIARKLPECLLCERKHVPGLIPGLIPGWDLVTLPGSVPERALCEQKPDQCRKGCVVVMTHFIVRLFYRVF